MIMTGSSCDDVFVLVLFTALLTTVSVGSFDFHIIWQIPVSVILGIAAGILGGLSFTAFFQFFLYLSARKWIFLMPFRVAAA